MNSYEYGFDTRQYFNKRKLLLFLTSSFLSIVKHPQEKRSHNSDARQSEACLKSLAEWVLGKLFTTDLEAQDGNIKELHPRKIKIGMIMGVCDCFLRQRNIS